MNFTSKLLSLVFLLLITAATAEAQRGQGNRNADPAERAKEQTERMTTDLSLSEKQAEKIGEVNLKYANKMKELRGNYQDSDRTALRETMRTLRKEQGDELKKYLTAEQVEQWNKIQEERRQQRGQRGGPKGEKNKDKSEGSNG